MKDLLSFLESQDKGGWINGVKEKSGLIVK